MTPTRPLYLPWKRNGSEIECTANLDILRHVAMASDEEYAAFIVQAVNSHEELKLALDEAIFCLTHCKTDPLMDEEHCLAVAIGCQQALAKAQGGNA